MQRCPSHCDACNCLQKMSKCSSTDESMCRGSLIGKKFNNHASNAASGLYGPKEILLIFGSNWAQKLQGTWKEDLGKMSLASFKMLKGPGNHTREWSFPWMIHRQNGFPENKPCSLSEASLCTGIKPWLQREHCCQPEALKYHGNEHPPFPVRLNMEYWVRGNLICLLVTDTVYNESSDLKHWETGRAMSREGWTIRHACTSVWTHITPF